MSNFTFCCPSCGQNLELDEQNAGELVDCPTCSQTIEVPHPAKPVSPQTEKQRNWRSLIKWALIATLALAPISLVWQVIRRVSGGEIFAIAGGLVGVLIGTAIIVVVVIWAVLWTLFPVFVYQYLKRIDSRLATLNDIAAQIRSRIRREEEP